MGRRPQSRSVIIISVVCASLFLYVIFYQRRTTSNPSFSDLVGCDDASKQGSLSFRPALHATQAKTKVKIDYYYNRSVTYNGPRVTYKLWPEDRPFPCMKETATKDWRSQKVQNSPAHKGLLYMAEMKTGSSTMSGIVLSLAHRKAIETWGKPLEGETFTPCKHRVDHGSAVEREYKQRDKKKSFLLTMLREPTKRAISKFFHFQVSSHQVMPTDFNFQSYFNHSPMDRNYYANDLSLNPIDWDEVNKLTGSQRYQVYDKIIQGILDEYDFIAITERMDESLVVLSRLLRLPLEDVLYVVTDNLSGSFVADDPKRNPCIYLVPSFLTPGMTKYFESEWWREEYVGLDYRLYHAAHVALDDTIDALGRASIEEDLKTFRKMLNVARVLCADETKHVCSPSGVFLGEETSTCLLLDMGCDHYCREGLRKRDWDQLIQQYGAA